MNNDNLAKIEFPFTTTKYKDGDFNGFCINPDFAPSFKVYGETEFEARTNLINSLTEKLAEIIKEDYNI